MEIFGKIDHGKIVTDQRFMRDVEKNEGKFVAIEIDPKDMKTRQQLGYLFGVVFKVVGEYVGCTPYETYEIVLERIPTKYHKVVNGKVHEFTKRLSTMTKEEASQFIDQALLFLRTNKSLKDVVIPESHYMEK